MGAHAPHRRGEKKIMRKLQGKFVNCTPSTPDAPPSRARVNFRTFLPDGEDLEVGVVHLDSLLRATTKKGRQHF